MSKSTLLDISTNLKQFFIWLRDQKGFKKIKLTEIKYFNMLENDIAIANGKKYKNYPTLEQIRKVIFENSFAKCNLPYYNLHSFRDALNMLGKKTCTLEQYQAFKSKFRA